MAVCKLKAAGKEQLELQLELSALPSVMKFSTGSELRGAAVAARTDMCTKGVASASSHTACTKHWNSSAQSFRDWASLAETLTTVEILQANKNITAHLKLQNALASWPKAMSQLLRVEETVV